MEIPSKISGQNAQISVLLSNSYGSTYKYFRCVVCGKVVFGYTNDEVRMILPTGHPQIGKAQHTIKCDNKLNIGDPQVMLHEIIAAVFASTDVIDVRTHIQELATRYDENKAAKCNAMYYVS